MTTFPWASPLENLRRFAVESLGCKPSEAMAAFNEQLGPRIGGMVRTGHAKFDPATRVAVFCISGVFEGAGTVTISATPAKPAKAGKSK